MGKPVLLRFTFLVAILALSVTAAFAQSSISARVLDVSSHKPMEYTNVILFRSGDSTQVGGTASDQDGRFRLSNIPAGRYYIDILFMGYQRKRVSANVENGRPKDLGDILMQPTLINLQDVVVEGNRSPMTYRIDKKVIDVSQMATSASGNAVEVLENVPSVSVDIDGNVSLRGSGNFTVLIDGKPTILDAQDALQQIPASLISTVEIITNPSAKYDPEGTAGIINIKLKENENRGMSALVNVNGGLRQKYGGEGLFEYKNGLINAVIGGDYNSRLYPGNSQEQNVYEYQGTTSYTSSLGGSNRQRKSTGFRGSLGLNITDNDLLTLGGRYGTRGWYENSHSAYDAWSDPGFVHTLSTNIVRRERSGDFVALSLDYAHQFPIEGHELTGNFRLSRRTGDELTLSELSNALGILDGKKTTETGPSRELNAKIDYVLPLGEKSKFEAGYFGRSDISEDDTQFFDHDSVSGTYLNLSQFSHAVRYDKNQHAFYSLLLNSWGNFGVQAGLRTEYTQRAIRLTSTGQEFLIDRWDLFPTLHTSYEFAPGDQVMASYTRRINRPRGWQLEPFQTWSDANNVREGNPALSPEFIDSYELGMQTLLGEATLSTDLYYRITRNKVESIRSVYSPSVTMRTFENVGADYAVGTEFLLNFDVVKNWTTNLIGNLYDYKVIGTLFNESFARKSFNWRFRLNNIFKFWTATQLQFNARYNSPSVSAQGRREGYFRADLALKQELLGKQLSLTLQVRDLFGTSKREFASEGPGFSTFSKSVRESPIVMLTLRFNINDFTNRKEQQQQEDTSGGFPEEEPQQ